MNNKILNQLTCILLGLLWLVGYMIGNSDTDLLISNIFIAASFIIGGSN